MPQIQSNCARTPLEERAIYYLNLNATHGHGDDLDAAYNQLMEHNGAYIRVYLGPDNLLLEIYREFRRDINKLLAEALGLGGRPPGLMPQWVHSDPLALRKTNRRLLAEFGIEEAMKCVYARHLHGESNLSQETLDMARQTWQGRWSVDDGSLYANPNDRQSVVSTQWVSRPFGISPPVLPPTRPTRPPTG